MSDDAISETVRSWVWSGFYDMDDIAEMLHDIVEEDGDEERGLACAETEFLRKRAAEASWESQTDCDRLDAAFEALFERGVLALQNAGDTMSDGLDDVSEELGRQDVGAFWGYCFYHGQDVERAIASGELWIAFGDSSPDDLRKGEAGAAVLAALRASGLEAQWDGDPEQRHPGGAAVEEAPRRQRRRVTPIESRGFGASLNSVRTEFAQRPLERRAFSGEQDEGGGLGLAVAEVYPRPHPMRARALPTRRVHHPSVRRQPRGGDADGAFPDDAVMQAIAAENNLAETAFLVPEGGDYRLRWFTPTTEVPLCGHATLASAAVVMERLEPDAPRSSSTPRAAP